VAWQLTLVEMTYLKDELLTVILNDLACLKNDEVLYFLPFVPSFMLSLSPYCTVLYSSNSTIQLLNTSLRLLCLIHSIAAQLLLLHKLVDILVSNHCFCGIAGIWLAD